jgi:GxxExxY protein
MSTNDESPLLLGDLTDKIIGALYRVHHDLGYGHAEVVYQRAVALLLRRQGIRVRLEVVFDVRYLGELVGRCRVDLLVEEVVVVEVKAATRFSPEWEKQLLSQLKSSNKQLGLLLFFGPKAAFTRLVGPAPDEAEAPSV